jgi:alpha-tubulin suppressor-like RCC1 family protein
VFSFGLGANGCLAHDGTEHQVLPKEVEALRGVEVASVSAGLEHALALTYTGGVYSWGKDWLVLGHGTAFESNTTPRRIEALRGCACAASRRDKGTHAW